MPTGGQQTSSTKSAFPSPSTSRHYQPSKLSSEQGLMAAGVVAGVSLGIVALIAAAMIAWCVLRRSREHKL